MDKTEKIKDRISEKIDTIIGAIIGSFVQTITTFILADKVGINLIIAFLAVLPFSFALFFTIVIVMRFFNRETIPNIPEANKSETPIEIKPPIQSNELMKRFEKIGIIEVTTRLSESKFEPEQCMAQANKKLLFMGIFGSKWVVVPHVRAEFQKALKRIQALNGTVRFLLFNPDSQYFEQLKTIRDGSISDESLIFFQQLMNEYSCLKVRLYDEMPCFRLVFINENILAVSRYQLDRKAYTQSKFGWEAPHLVIDANTPWSFYAPFENYYDQIWNRSKDLDIKKENNE